MTTVRPPVGTLRRVRRAIVTSPSRRQQLVRSSLLDAGDPLIGPPRGGAGGERRVPVPRRLRCAASVLEREACRADHLAFETCSYEVDGFLIVHGERVSLVVGDDL